MRETTSRAYARHGRRGAIIPLAAVMLTVMVGMVAYAVDLGYMAVVRCELQNAADSAAMAGAQKLISRELLQGATAQTTGESSARTQAVAFAGYHRGGGQNLLLDRNNGNSTDGDVLVGTIANPSDPNSPMVYNVTPYNSVQVKVHRDDVRNGPLALFFARIWGRASQEMEATATATADGYVKGFKIRTTGPRTSRLLPYALDINVWNDKVVNGNGDDGWTYNPQNNQYSAGSDGIHEAKLFPNKGIAPGNFGTIDIGTPGNSTSELSRQILYGPNETDLAYYSNGEFKLNALGFILTGGDTGISAGAKDELATIRGQPRIMPLYEPPVVGTGNTAQFKIVKFVGVIVTEVVLEGSQSSKHLTIQPEFVIDPTAITGGTTTSSTYVYKGVFLTR